MNETDVALTINLTYDSIPTPQKIVLPLEEGKFGIFRYRQHPNDPLSIEGISFGYVNEHQIKIKMTGSGQLKVDNFPGVRIGGTIIELKAAVILKNMELRITDLKIARLDFPNILNFADKLLGNLFNNILLKHLSEKLTFDLSDYLESAIKKINKTIPINFEVVNTKYNYELFFSCEIKDISLNVLPDGIQIQTRLSLEPRINMV